MNNILSGIRGIKSYEWIRAIAILAAIIHFIIVIFIVFSRINYRYELEWMEGASLIEVYRVLTGQSLYIQPSLEYIPLIYPPLYFYLSAVLTKITGIGFLPLRIVSFISTLGCLTVIYFVVKDKTSSVLYGIVAAGTFAATFRLGGAWFDIARVDMLFIFLCLAGYYFLGKQTTKSSIIAGLLFSLSFLTKQTALPIFLVLVVSTILLFRKQTIPFISSFMLLTLITFAYLNFTTTNWYQYYILTLPASHQIKWASLPTALQSSFEVTTIMILVGFAPVLFGFRQIIKDKLHLYYYFAVSGTIATSVLALINRGAYINTLVPAYAGLSIIFGLGIDWLVSLFKQQELRGELLQSALWLAIIIQFVWLGYKYYPTQQIPTQADQKAGDALVSELRAAPGDVLIPYHNYLSLFAGKKVNFHMITFDEIRGRFSKKQPAIREILQQFHATHFSLFIMDVPDNLLLFNHCADTQTINYESAGTFYPVTGYSVRPTIRYVDCP